MSRIVPALGRGLDILEAVRDADAPPSASDLGDALGLPRTTVHELLVTLLERGYLESDEGMPRRFRLGLRTFELGNAYAAGLDLAREAQDVAAAVAGQTDETVHVAVRDRADVVYVAKVDSTHSVRMVSAVGVRLPAHLTAVGKMLLSAVGDEDLARLYPPGRELAGMTAASIRSPDELRGALEAIRRDGIAWDHCESNAAVNCVAAPVHDHSGATVAAISIAVPTYRWTDAQAGRFAELVREGAAQLSRRLGHAAAAAERVRG